MDNKEKIENMSLDDKCVPYLQMLQSAIDRMSTSAALFKGFAATIISGIIVVSISEMSVALVICSLIPLVLFAIMDIYYLQLEKRYRFMYSQVKNGIYPCDYNMSPPKVRDILKSDKTAKVCWYHCVGSPSIWLFYGPMVIACLGLLMFILLKSNSPST